MADPAVMRRKLAALRGFLDGLRRRFAAMDRATFVASEDAQLVAERLLHLACESCIDLANHVLSARGFEQPETYRQAFELLGKHGLIPAELSPSLQQMAVMRNILVHGYAVVDPAKVHEVVVHRLGDLEQFAGHMARLV